MGKQTTKQLFVDSSYVGNVTGAVAAGDDVTVTLGKIVNSIATSNLTAVSAAISTETTRAEAAEALLAPIASPTFTGAPQAPTPATGDNSTSIASTAFVNAAVATETTRAEAAEALLAPKASVLGNANQSWQDMTASRSLGTTYTNTTSAPIEIAVTLVTTTLSNPFTILNLFVGGVNVVSNTATNAGSAVYPGVTAIVPVGVAYYVQAYNGSLYSFYELR